MLSTAKASRLIARPTSSSSGHHRKPLEEERLKAQRTSKIQVKPIDRAAVTTRERLKGADRERDGKDQNIGRSSSKGEKTAKEEESRKLHIQGRNGDDEGEGSRLLMDYVTNARKASDVSRSSVVAAATSLYATILVIVYLAFAFTEIVRFPENHRFLVRILIVKILTNKCFASS